MNAHIFELDLRNCDEINQAILENWENGYGKKIYNTRYSIINIIYY